jgi:hypothetical protein
MRSVCSRVWRFDDAAAHPRIARVVAGLSRLRCELEFTLRMNSKRAELAEKRAFNSKLGCRIRYREG